MAEAASAAVGGKKLGVCLNRHNMLMLKVPFNPAPVEWHQDAAVWDEGTYEHITAIVAVDDFRPNNGALQMLPGSGVAGRVSRQPAKIITKNLTPAQNRHQSCPRRHSPLGLRNR